MQTERLLIIPDKQNMDKTIQLAKAYGCGFEYNDFYLPKVLEDENQIETLIAEYQQMDLPEYCTLHGAFLDIAIHSDDPLMVQASDKRIRQSLDIAVRLGAKKVVFHTNYIANFLTDFYRENWLQRNAQYWSRMLDAYPSVEICIENMFDTDWELLAKLGERMQGHERFGICFDYAHAHVFGDEGRIADWVKALAPYVKHIHINDNDFKKDLHWTLGEGSIDWKQFKWDYETYFPEASVLLEVSGVDKIEKSLEFLKTL